MSARKKMGLPLQMGIGMVLGILVGTLAPKLGISAAFFKPFGDLFINLVRMVVVPLVLATLVSGAASVGDVGRLGRVAAKTLVFYFATTALAVAIGLILGNIFQPGVGLDLSTANLSAKEVAAPSLVQVLMGIVPLNPVDALAKGNILQIIFFAVLVGMAISLCGDKAKPAAAFFDAMSEVMIRVTSMVMHYAPIGVFALMAHTVSNHGVGTMGVPGAALIMLSMIFTHVGIPLEAIALVAGIDRVMDMARTTINVLGDATAAIFISRTENDFDPQRGAALQDE